MNEYVADLFQDTLVQDKLDYLKKHKNIAWLWSQDLRLVNEEQELRDIVALALSKNTPIAVDTETTGLTKDCRLVGISAAFQNDGKITAFYVPIYSEVDTVGIPPEKTLSILKPLLEKPCIYRNFKFDYKFIKSVGIEAKLLADISTMELCPRDGIDDATFNRLKSMSLKDRYADIFKEDMIDLEEALGKGIYSFALAPNEMARFYAAPDALCTLKIWQYLSDKINPDDFILKLEKNLLPLVADMEYEGIKIDTSVLKEAKTLIMGEQAEYESKIYHLCGEKINLNSGPQLGGVLFNKLGLKCQKLTPGGDESVSKSSLEMTLESIPADTVDENEIKGKEILESLFSYKSNEKLLTAFVENLMSQITTDGKVHPVFKTLGAVSHRFSCSAPNLQQVPKAEEGNKAIIRKAFIADEGRYLLSCDYSQVELRILASFSKDPNLTDAFMNGIDVHKRTAAMLFNKPMEEVTKTDRYKAKTINFGLLYGLGPPGLARQLKCSLEESKELYDLYFSKLASVKAWLNNTKNKIKETGVSVSHWGSKRLLPNAKLPYNWNDKTPEGQKNNQLVGDALRAGCNHRIQSTSANITKIAMVRLGKALKGLDVKMLVQVHDQVIFSVSESIKPDEIVPIIKEAMEIKVDGFVPLTVDTDLGYSWGGFIPYTPGMTIDSLPIKEKLIVSGDIPGNANTIKSLFKAYPGDNEVYLQVGATTIQPNTVDEDGVVEPIKVLASKKLIAELENIGLKVV